MYTEIEKREIVMNHVQSIVEKRRKEKAAAAERQARIMRESYQKRLQERQASNMTEVKVESKQERLDRLVNTSYNKLSIAEKIEVDNYLIGQNDGKL